MSAFSRNKKQFTDYLHSILEGNDESFNEYRTREYIQDMSEAKAM